MARTIRPIEAFAIIGFLSVAQSEKNGVPIKSRRFDIEYFVNLNVIKMLLIVVISNHSRNYRKSSINIDGRLSKKKKRDEQF